METGLEFSIPEDAGNVIIDAMEHLGRARVELRAAKSKLVLGPVILADCIEYLLCLFNFQKPKCL